MAPATPIPRLSGSVPGVLDPTQKDRILRVPGTRLTFAVFDPRVAIAQDIPDMRKLSIKEELYRPKRVVVETFPSGESFWRFVPSARKEAGVADEGIWPRHIELCGQIVECTQDQWDIYKLDPSYECLVRPPPLLSTISSAVTRSHNVYVSPGKRDNTSVTPDPDTQTPHLPRKQKLNGEESHEGGSSDDEDEEEDEVEDMIIDDGHLGTRSSRGPTRRGKTLKEQMLKQREQRREKISRRAERLADRKESIFTFTRAESEPSTSVEANLQGKRKVDYLVDPLRCRDESAFGHANGDYIPRNGVYYAPSTQYKRTRTVSPSAAKRELESKRLEREKQKRERREKDLLSRREQRDHRFMQDVLADIQESSVGANGEHISYDSERPDHSEYQGTRPQNSESESDESRRLAEIEESRRKLAELEKDRPIWEEMARIRKEQEIAEEKERRARADAIKRAELKAEQVKREKAEKEQAELRRKEALMREQEAHARRESERRQRQRRWALGPWTTQRALEKYKVLCEAFDNTKFSETEPLTIDSIPWPTLHSPATFSVEDVDWTAVENFFEAVRSHMRPQDYKDFVQSSHRRFHPDRWRSRSLLKTILDEAERGCIEVAANTVAQALTPLWRELTGR